MTTINEGIKKVKCLAEEIDQNLTTEENILGMHESATKLWGVVSGDKNNAEEISRRVASALIGVFIVADKLGVQDMELCLKNTMEEIKEVQTKKV